MSETSAALSRPFVSVRTAATKMLALVSQTPPESELLKYGPVHIFAPDNNFCGLIFGGGGPDHARGISGIKSAFGIRDLSDYEDAGEMPPYTGLELRRMRRLPDELQYTYKRGVSRLSFNPNSEHVPTHIPSDVGIPYGVWGPNHFSVVMRMDKRGLLNRLVVASEENDLILCLSNDSPGRTLVGKNMFGLFIASAVPAVQQLSFEERDQKSIKDARNYWSNRAEDKGSYVLRGNDSVLAAPAPVPVLEHENAA